VTLRIVLIDVIVAFLLGWWLISQFGIVGAAISALLTRVMDFFLHYVPVSRMLSRMAITRLAWKSAVAGMVMTGVVLLLKSQGILLSVFAGATVYMAVMAGLVAGSLGAPRSQLAKVQMDAANGSGG
jgi:hypothetical protein